VDNGELAAGIGCETVSVSRIIQRTTSKIEPTLL